MLGRSRGDVGRRCATVREVEQVLETPRVLTPGRIGPLTLRNRIIKAATYEGLSHRSRVTTDLVDFHRAYAAGGVGMTTVAYCAVAPEGRTAPDQIVWTDEAMRRPASLTEAVHAEGAAVAAQIGHAGPVADPRGNGAARAVAEHALPEHVRRHLPQGDGRRHRPDHRRARRRLGAADRGGLRRGRGPPRPQLPRQLVPEPEDQPPQGRVRRDAGQPGQGSRGESCAPYAMRSATGSPS